MAAPEKKEKSLEVVVPESGYPRTMYFNRYRVERHSVFSLVYFGLVSESGVIVDSYCCAFTHDALEANKKALMEYLGKLGVPKDTLPTWSNSSGIANSGIADIIGMTYTGNFAETQLALYSRNAVFRASQEKQSKASVQGQAVALLRSEKEIQAHLIKAMYE